MARARHFARAGLGSLLLAVPLALTASQAGAGYISPDLSASDPADDFLAGCDPAGGTGTGDISMDIVGLRFQGWDGGAMTFMAATRESVTKYAATNPFAWAFMMSFRVDGRVLIAADGARAGRHESGVVDESGTPVAGAQALFTYDEGGVMNVRVATGDVSGDGRPDISLTEFDSQTQPLEDPATLVCDQMTGPGGAPLFQIPAAPAGTTASSAPAAGAPTTAAAGSTVTAATAATSAPTTAAKAAATAAGGIPARPADESGPGDSGIPWILWLLPASVLFLLLLGFWALDRRRHPERHRGSEMLGDPIIDGIVDRMIGGDAAPPADGDTDGAPVTEPPFEGSGVVSSDQPVVAQPGSDSPVR